MELLFTFARIGREKIVHREVHFLKESAGVGRIRAYCAFFFGNAEFACGKHKSHRSFDSDNAEKAERNIKAFCSEIFCHSAAQASADVFGDLIAGAAAASEFVLLFNKFYRKADRGGNLHNNFGHICFEIAGIAHIMAKIIAELFGCKDAHIAFASEKHAFFVVNGKAAEFLTLSAGNTSFKKKFEIEAYIYRIVTFVEGNGIHGYICVDDFCTFTANVCCSVDYVLTAFGEKNFYVFKTILISYRIIYLVAVNAGGAVQRFAVLVLSETECAAYRRAVSHTLTILF